MMTKSEAAEQLVHLGVGKVSQHPSVPGVWVATFAATGERIMATGDTKKEGLNGLLSAARLHVARNPERAAGEPSGRPEGVLAEDAGTWPPAPATPEQLDAAEAAFGDGQ